MKFKNIVLGIGIVIVFALVLWQGIETFYPSQQYEDYCGNVSVPQSIESQKMAAAVPGVDYVYSNATFCLAHNGTWQNGYCDYYYVCQKSYESAMDGHSRVVFYISLIVAVIAFIIGFLILSVEPVGSALLGSGVWAIFYGSVVNWRNIGVAFRFVLLLFVLVLLIYIALRLNRKDKKSKFWQFWK